MLREEKGLRKLGNGGQGSKGKDVGERAIVAMRAREGGGRGGCRVRCRGADI